MFRYPFTVAVCFVLIALVVWAGRSLAGRRREFALRMPLCLAAIGVWLGIQAWSFWPSVYDPTWSWPLHICDLAAIIAPLALLTRWRLLRTALYFWGIGLTTQGFFTPVITVGPESIMYWLFWANHTIVVGLAVYDLVVGGYRPRFSDVLAGVGLTGLWVAVVLPIDLAWGWNYGFLNDVDLPTGSLLDAMPPWPLRILVMEGLTILGFLVLWAVWPAARVLGRAIRRRDHDTPPDA